MIGKSAFEIIKVSFVTHFLIKVKKEFIICIDKSLFWYLGHYCPNGTKVSNQYPCPSGTFSNNTGIGSASDCLMCLGKISVRL